MTRVPVAGANAACDIRPVAKLHRAKLVDYGSCIAAGVNWRDLRIATSHRAAIEIFHFHLLDRGGVREHDFTERAGCCGGINRTRKSGARQFGQQPAVIDVRMREQDRIDLARIEGEGL